MHSMLHRTACWQLMLGVVLLFAGCSKKPSFYDREYRADRSTANATVSSEGKQPIVPNVPEDDGGFGEDPTNGDLKDPGEDVGGDQEDGSDEVSGGDGVGGDDGDGLDGSDSSDDSDASDGSDGSDGGGDGGEVPRQKITRDMTFPSHRLMNSQVAATLDAAYIEQTLTMERIYHDKSREVQQEGPPEVIDEFYQGHRGDGATDTFTQEGGKLLDILVVIDNSGSMYEEQVNLADKMQPLLSFVEDADWRIGVVTTDPSETCLRALIEKSDSDATRKFARAVNAGTRGDSNERGILTAVRSLSGSCLTSPWIRERSTLAVLIVSDEDNCSNGRGCPGKNYAKADFLYDYLASIREPGKNARVYGLIWHPSQSHSQCYTARNAASIYAEVISRTDGAWGSICDRDYTQTLSEISEDISMVLDTKFTLSHAPDPGSLHVYVDGQELPSGFTLTDKVVEFAEPPADGSQIVFEYHHGAEPIFTRFTLRFEPYKDLETVYVDGQVVDKSSYTMDGRTVVFNVPPPEKAKIRVEYGRDTVLNDEFVILDSIRKDSMRAFVNDVETLDFTVDYPLGLVRFNTPPAAKAMVRFEYQSIGDPALRYPFTAAYDHPQDLQGFDGQTGDPIGVSYEPGFVIVDEDDFAEGRTLLIRYDNIDRQNFEVELPNDPLAGTVRAMGGQVICDSAPGLDVVGRHVYVDNCGFADDVTVVFIDYQFIAEEYGEFVFDAEDLPLPGDFQEWTVWVNGVETTDYTRTGNIFKFDTPLPVVSEVRIQLTQNAP